MDKQVEYVDTIKRRTIVYKLSDAERLTFDTFSDMFKDYDNGIENENYDNETRYFEVPKDWAVDWIRKHCRMEIDEFWSEYTWDDTADMYDSALAEEVILNEQIWRYAR